MPCVPGVPTTRVYPSGALFATSSQPTMPFAPVRFSMITCCPQDSVSFWPTVRASRSDGPPGANGTTMRIGLTGYWAVAGAANAAAAAVAINNSCQVALMMRGDYQYDGSPRT